MTEQTTEQTKISANFKELKEAIDFAIATGKAISDAYADDGKITIEDLPLLFGPLQAIGPALTGFGDIPLEFKMASKEEATELKAYVQEKLDLEDDKVEAFIEDSFAVLVDLWYLINTYFLMKKEEMNQNV